jgi:hypothetical protein
MSGNGQLLFRQRTSRRSESPAANSIKIIRNGKWQIQKGSPGLGLHGGQLGIIVASIYSEVSQ